MSVAVAVFVKTAGLSPVKTRLAASIGSASAEEFHCLSARATESFVRDAVARSRGQLTPYWAVAENEGLTSPFWSGFERIWQGEGGLGERLDRVYSTLLEKHNSVLLMGADSPQLRGNVLLEAMALLQKDDQYVIGNADDGGFYLFGGRGEVSREVWLSVPYSAQTTSHVLRAKIQGRGEIFDLAGDFDVDSLAELERLRARLEADREHATPAQLELLEWLAGIDAIA